MTLHRRYGRQLILVLLSLGLIGLALGQIRLPEFLVQLERFRPAALGLVLAMLTLNLAMAWLRFWRLLGHIGYRIRAKEAWIAFLQGQLASFFVVQLLGQMAGRGLALARYGVSPSALAALSVYERGTLLVTSMAMAIAGGLYLLGHAAIGQFLNRFPMGEIGFVLVAAVAFSQLLGKSRHEVWAVRNLCSIQAIRGLAEAVALAVVGQGFILAAFTAASLAVHPDVPVLGVLAASAVISFLASLPISVNGWGVREIAAVTLLGPLGFTNAEALAVSVVIGVCATVVVLAPAPLLLRRRSGEHEDAEIRPGVRQFDKLAAWMLGGLGAFLILFQFHIQLPFGAVNINLADPLALLGLAALLVTAALRREAPTWRLPYVNRWILLASATMMLGFGIGVWHIGVTGWALSNRLLGWFVLLGYAALGAWFVQMNGLHGLRRLVDYLVACAVAIVMVQAAQLLPSLGESHAPVAISGFAGNRNAFAFQLLACMAGLLAWSPLRMRAKRRLFHDVALATVFAGIVLTQSRTALAVAGVLLAVTWWQRPFGRRTSTRATVFFVALPALLSLLYFLYMPSAFEGLLTRGYDSFRWKTFQQALDMWLDAPIFGQGIGVFLYQSVHFFPWPIVIHNIFLWWLAELGLLGFIVFCGGLFGLAVWAAKRPGQYARLALMLTLILALFGLAHDVFYQRIFWFLLGAVLVAPALQSPRPTVSLKGGI